MSKWTRIFRRPVSSLEKSKQESHDTDYLALNNFTGFEITDSQLLLPPREDGVNLIANATLPNPSVLTLEIVRPIYPRFLSSNTC